MPETIELYQQDDRIYVTHPWPQEAKIADDLINNSKGLIQGFGTKLVIKVENGYGLYEWTESIDLWGYRTYKLIEESYSPITYTS